MTRSTRYLLVLATLAAACSGEPATAPRPPAPRAQPDSSALGARAAHADRLRQQQAAFRTILASLEKAGSPDERSRADAADLRDAIARLDAEIARLRGPWSASAYDESATYEEGGAVPVFVTSGTKTQAYLTSGFSATTQTTFPAFLHTQIRGNSSQGGWTGSSDDGFSASADAATTYDAAALSVPESNRNCKVSAVTLSANTEHSAGYYLKVKVGAVGFEVRYQVGSMNTPASASCEHTPASGTVYLSDAQLTVGGLPGEATAEWVGEKNTFVDGCPTTWSSSNGSVASVSASSVVPGGASITAVGAGTASITATCRGASASASITVVSDTPPPSPPPSGGGEPVPPPSEPPPPTGGWKLTCYAVYEKYVSNWGEEWWQYSHDECEYVWVNNLVTGAAAGSAAPAQRTIAVSVSAMPGKLTQPVTVLRRKQGNLDDVILVDLRTATAADVDQALQFLSRRQGAGRLPKEYLFAAKQRAPELRDAARVAAANDLLRRLAAAPVQGVDGVGSVPAVPVELSP